MRKSSRRSDQRMPPRAMSPARRWTPSTDGDATQISCCGRGRGRKSSAGGSNLNARYGSAAVRVRAHHRPPRRATSARRIRSASRLATASMARPSSASSGGLGGRIARPRGIEALVEPRDEQAHRVGVRRQRVGEVRIGEAHARPDGGTGRARARSRRRATSRPARSTSRFSSSFSIVPAHTPRKTSATRACVAGSPSGSPTSATHTERVDPPRDAVRRVDLVRALVDHRHAEVLEQRHHVGEHQRAAGPVELDPGDHVADRAARAGSRGRRRDRAPRARRRRRRRRRPSTSNW